jgi:signal transduction histidine kinase/DNA-binding response OmpR family regulator/CHASE3 domain sensor protein
MAWRASRDKALLFISLCPYRPIKIEKQAHMNTISRPGLLRNLQIGFGLSLLLLVITAVASYSSIRNLLDSSQWVDHTDSVLIKLDRVHSLLRDAESAQRGYLLTGDIDFQPATDVVQSQVKQVVDTIEAMTNDNPRQVENLAELRKYVFQPLPLLQKMIDQKKADNTINAELLLKTHEYMVEIRRVLQRMSEEEHRLMPDRVSRERRYAGYTPALILATALLSLLITIFFYGRVHRDFLERQGLYAELQQKDAAISRRIDIISGIADQISAGNYQTRVSDEQKDNLGTLSGALNKMAESLEYSFRLLSDKEWLQTGIARLNEVMVGETDLPSLMNNVVRHIAEYSNSRIGAFYLLDRAGGTLMRGGHYALADRGSRTIRLGEGLVGQVAKEGKPVVIKDLRESDWVVSLASGELRPRTIVAFPFFHGKKVRGVIELGTMMNEYPARKLEFFASIGENIGIAVHSIESRLKLQELLEKTQAQTEELQSQHTEMESLNLELEVQAEKLQVSEEELKVQQEELLQTNQELEERSRTLEEKNQLVLIRNLEIQKKAEELALTTKYKSEFMANMSHELRTPMNSILLLSRLLSENSTKNLTDEQTEYARVIQNSGQGLLQLIDEILDLSRIESGKLPLEHSIVPVEELLGDMRMLFAPIAKDKGLELHIVMDEGTPAQLETDKMRLEQILKNLLSNAFKFTQRGAVTLQVRSSATRQHVIEFVVRDTGIGIPEDKHELIFEAFQQADGSTRRKYGGTGLGLSISRELSRLLGGEITLRSQPEQGSEFTVAIPVFKMEGVVEPAAPGGGMIREASPADRWPAPVFTLSKAPMEIPDDRGELQPGDKVLLIVEDDTFFAQGLLDFSRKKGYKGVVAVSGDAAIRMARQYRPMGILLDIQLPVKNGWEVMEELKKDPQTRPIPVHIISSFEVKNESLLKGAVNFMSKSLAFDNMDKIFGKIETLLNKSARKVIIVEDNMRHAQALAYFLGAHSVRMDIVPTIAKSEDILQQEGIHGVILSREAGKEESDTLEMIRRNPAFENIPIIVFTGVNISKTEEARLRQYADSIVVKTAHSYQRVLDEVSLFLHVVSGEREKDTSNAMSLLGALDEVLKNRTVLIADDDVRNIFSLSRALEQHKMKVVTAMDGKEALAVAEENEIDLVLMDMMMPEMDGFEAITRIRRNPKLRHLPIIAVTAKAMAGDRERCIQAGASDYISKPLDIDQLLSLLRIWLYEK